MFIADLCAPVVRGHDALPGRLKSRSLYLVRVVWQCSSDKSTCNGPESLLAYMREIAKIIAAADVHIGNFGFSLSVKRGHLCS